MKKLIKEDENECLLKLLGEKVTIFTSGYFYTGILSGVNDVCIKLDQPSIVYETGKFSNPEWENCQSLCVDSWYINIPAIESFGLLK